MEERGTDPISALGAPHAAVKAQERREQAPKAGGRAGMRTACPLPTWKPTAFKPWLTWWAPKEKIQVATQRMPGLPPTQGGARTHAITS